MMSREWGPWVEWLPLVVTCGVAPFFLFPTPRTLWIFPAVLLGWALRGAVRGRMLARTKLDWPLAVILAQVFIACLRVPDINFSLPKVAGIVLGISLFYALMILPASGRSPRLILYAFAAGGLILSLLGLFGLIWHAAYWWSEKPFFKVVDAFSRFIPKINLGLPGAETGFNSNALGGTLLLIFPLVASFFFDSSILGGKHGRGRRPILKFAGWGLALGLMSITLFFTQSMICWLAAGLSIWLLVLDRRWKIRSGVILALIIGLLFVSGTFRRAGLRAESASRFISTRVGGHAYYWRAGLDAIALQPLWGVGPNRLRLDPRIGYEKAHAHNQLIHTGAELGLPALGAYVLILIGIGSMSRAVWQAAKKGWRKPAIQGLAAGQLAFVLFGLGDAIPLGSKAGLVFWVSLGLIVLLYNEAMDFYPGIRI